MKKLFTYLMCVFVLLLITVSAFAQADTLIDPISDTVIYCAVFAGMMLYFVFEYQTKKRETTEFSFGFWIKDNWFNFVVIGACLAGYIFIGDGLPETKKEAFFLGFAGNKIVDYFQDLFTKKKV